MATTFPGSTTLARGTPRSRFFLWIAVAMLLAAVLGFGPTFYFRPLSDRGPLEPHVVVHGLVMTTWYLLLLAQTVLVARGRRDLHRGLGIAGLLLAAAVFATGIHVNLAVLARAPADALGMYLDFVMMGIGGLLPFPLLIGLAVAFRRDPATHKRLMFWAFVLTIGPAFASSRAMGAWLDGLVAPALPFFPSDLLWFAALVIHDWRSLRRVHPATWIGFIALAAYLVVGLEWLARNEAARSLVLSWAGPG